MKNLLIINAHQLYPGISTGRLNQVMAGVIAEEMASRGYAVRQTVLDRGLR